MIGGLLSLSVLLFMMVMQFLREDLAITEMEAVTLLLLIGALLGVDMLVEEKLRIKVEREEVRKDDRSDSNR